ncbi:MAG: PaaI family thioesterase [Clostridia bacterium]|nr:PaaI family thioesterase [Clostridia bacterium]
MNHKIINPFAGKPGYNCFGCSPDNKLGLRLSFVNEGEYIVAQWQPQPQFQGYQNLLHGGIQATLLDEIASWYVYARLQTAGVTSRLDVRYRKPVYTDQGALTLRARLLEKRRNLADIETELLNNAGVLCAGGVIQYYTFNEQVAREKYWYPGAEAFYKEL